MASISTKTLTAAMLGSAALLVPALGNAADLPSRKAEPVQYLRVCDAYGAGFFVLPGTDTCIKTNVNIQANYYYTPAQNVLVLQQSKAGGFNSNPAPLGGFAPVDKIVSYDPNAAGGSSASTAWQNGATEDATGFQSDVRAGFQAVTATEYGALRTFAVLRAKFNSGVFDGSGPNGITGSGGSSTKMSLDRAYVQFMGITAGYQPDPFAAFFYEDDIATSLLDPKGSASAAINYTFVLGSGITFLAGVDAPQLHISKDPQIGGAVRSCCAGLDAVAGQQLGVATLLGPYTWPDIDLVARIDQAWGGATVAGLIHPISQLAVGTSPAAAITNNTLIGPNAGLPSVALRDTGFAVLGAVKINLPMLGPKDHLFLQAIYSNGAAEAAGIGGNQGSYSSGSNPWLLGGFYRSDNDAIAVANLDGSFTLEKERYLEFLFAMQHWWVPDTLRTNILANYNIVTPGSRTQNTDWLKGGLSKATELKLGGNIVWTPFAGLDIGVEVMHTNLWQKLTNDPGFAPSCSPGGPLAPGSASCSLLSGIRVNPQNWEGILNVARKF